MHATPKQIAFLSYMGIPEAARMTKQQASDRIENLMEVQSQEEWEWLFQRKGSWITDRFILHPDLYASEFRQFLDLQLPEVMHTYVRSRVTGASETLTKSKIRKVIHTITDEDPEWWKAPNQKERFFDRLSILYPGCCNGGPVTKKTPTSPRVPQQRFSMLDHQTLRSLLTHYAEFCEPWELAFSSGQKDGNPHELLGTLDAIYLDNPICEFCSGNNRTTYTIEIKRLFRIERVTFEVTWHTDRHGWADAGPGSKAVHYFVPRAWMKDPPYTSDGMLVALCKKNWIANDSPFYPVSADRTLCRTCTAHHENWNSSV